MGLFRRIYNFFFPKKFYLDPDELDLDDLDFGEGSTLIYYDPKSGESYSVSIICSCQTPLIILDVDYEYDPPLTHFECSHCDRVCTIKQCQLCLVYSDMLKARILMEEPPKEQPPEQQ